MRQCSKTQISPMQSKGDICHVGRWSKNGAKSASNGQTGAVRKLDGQDHGLPQQRYDRPGLVSGKRAV